MPCSYHHSVRFVGDGVGPVSTMSPTAGTFSGWSSSLTVTSNVAGVRCMSRCVVGQHGHSNTVRLVNGSAAYTKGSSAMHRTSDSSLEAPPAYTVSIRPPLAQ